MRMTLVIDDDNFYFMMMKKMIRYREQGYCRVERLMLLISMIDSVVTEDMHHGEAHLLRRLFCLRKECLCVCVCVTSGSLTWEGDLFTTIILAFARRTLSWADA